jgi:hypothetical protein
MRKYAWERIAVDIGEDASAECGSDRDAAMDFIHESVDGCRDVIITARAWETVSSARINDSEVYDMAHSDLISTLGDKIQPDETIDNVVTRLAYWIIFSRAIMAYDAAQDQE